MRAHLIAALITAKSALATPVNEKFCVTLDLSFTDQAAGDHLTADTVPAKGIRLAFIPSAGDTSFAYADSSGADEGCVTVPLDDTKTWEVKICGRPT